MSKKQKKSLIKILVAGALALAVNLIPYEGLLEGAPEIAVKLVKAVLNLIPYLIVGYETIKKAVRGIMKKQVFDEHFLMAVATVGAFALGEYSEAVAVMLFYQIGELFESYAVGKSRRNISNLMDIRPDYANVLENGELVKKDPDEVAIGSLIKILPGEKVPIDGIITEGNSTLDTSALTGESVPREALEGDEIISGCINLTGVITVKTTKEFGESTVSKILELVENASSRKSKSEAFISKFAKVYTPIVCYAALALAIIPPIVLMIMGRDANWGEWIYRALSFLVISCPCALVISIPLSFFGGIGGASREGVLVKGSNYLEALANVKYVVFDKTGTLTKGVFKVTDAVPMKDWVEKSELIRMAAGAEVYSSHPIALSLIDACDVKPSREDTKDVKEIPGHGLEAVVKGDRIAAGNAKLMKSMNLSIPDISEAGTIVHVAKNGEYVGYVIISDEIKEGSAEGIDGLKKTGVSKSVMLTGDAKKAADAVAKKLGITEYHAELLPEDKVNKVEELLSNKGENEILAFVGDGINDAPVLSRADVGIAMGAMGSDAAIEAADVVLMDDDPRKISKAIRIARKCMRIVYENIWLAIGIKVACLILSALGIANMWLAIFADVGVMVLAVLNAIRALNVKRV
ncbi:MAG: cadmium-translocating P-type ATPase [Lachnospiraceae bacterium]|jgi:Cd2+/Zn2+-exporting ATPase|nr:cadmium-translocating P-type ATPase [Lachnospiraceae bacterium]